MIKVENLKEQLAKTKNKPFHPLDVAIVNNHQIRIGTFKGDYGWHTHDADEFFYVIDGKISIHLKEKELVLNKHDYVELPKGTPHNLSSKGESYVLVVKPIHLRTAKA